LVSTSLEAAHVLVWSRWGDKDGGEEEYGEEEYRVGKYAVSILTYKCHSLAYHRLDETFRIISTCKDLKDYVAELRDTWPDAVDARLYDTYTNTQETFDGGVV
jgi:hypothetical protein